MSCSSHASSYPNDLATQTLLKISFLSLISFVNSYHTSKIGLAVHTSLCSIVLLGTRRIFQRPNTKFSSASSLLPLLRPDCRLNIQMTSIMIKAKWQRSPGLLQHAVEATPDLLDGFVAARQHGTGRTLFIMLMLHVFMASRITLDQDTELQYRFCALGFFAYIVIDGGFHISALAKLYRDLRTWKNATFLICISMVLSRCIFFSIIFGAPPAILLSQRLSELVAPVSKSTIG